MWQLAICSVAQSALLASGQVVLKLALARLPEFSWTSGFWLKLLANWPLALTGVLFASASLLWLYIVKNFPLSQAYPLTSLSYVFGMLAAALFFDETVSASQVFGAVLIVLGCGFMVK